MERKLNISAIPALVGVWGRDAALQTWREVRGLTEPRPQTFIMRLGEVLTDDILTLSGVPQDAVLELPCQLRLAGGVLSGRCDAFDGEGRVWEAKAVGRVSERAHLAAELQAQLYAAALDARAIRLVFLETASRTLIVRDVEPDVAVVQALQEAIERLFASWDDDEAVLGVQLYDTPVQAPTPTYVDEAAAAATLAEELYAIREQRRVLEEREAALRRALLELFPQDGTYSVGSYRITVSSSTTWRLDLDALPSEIIEQYRRTSVRRTLLVKKAGEP